MADLLESVANPMEELLTVYRADVDVLRYHTKGGGVGNYHPTNPSWQQHMEDRLSGKERSPVDWTLNVESWERVPACRCYRCGTLLTVDTMHIDAAELTGVGTVVRPLCHSCALTA